MYEISDIYKLLSHIMFIDGESVLWTIGPEIQFYFIFIGLWFLAAWRPGYVYVLIITVLILLFFTNFPRLHGNIQGISYNFFYLSRSLPYFFVGVIFGMHYKSFEAPKYLKKNLFVTALLLIPLMYPEFSPVATDAKMKMWLNYEVLFVMSVVFFCVVFLVPENNILLANKIGDFFGEISYSLYLLHLPIIVQLNKLDLPVELKLLLFLLLSVIMAYISYRYLEKPAAKLVRIIAFNKFSQQSVKAVDYRG